MTARQVPADEIFMRRALCLAARGRTGPNPRVGAVVVKAGRIVGEAYHRRVGEPHAERLALAAAGTNAGGSTLYVNLEPCCHHGRTPPCVEAIFAAGVRRVVAAMADPDPRVNGRGVAALRRAGVEVEVGCLGGEAARLNQAFIKAITTGLPWVTLKLAMSLDGRTAAPGRRRLRLTGPEAMREVHRLRARHDVVMVGRGTVAADDPLLTVRLVAGENPLRVVLDTGGNTPPGSRLLGPDLAGGTCIYVGERCPRPRRQALAAGGATVTAVAEKGGRVDPRACLLDLAALGMRSVLLEGGPTLAGSFLREGLVDSVCFFYAPLLLGDKAPAAVEVPEGLPATPLRPIRWQRFGRDFMFQAYVAAGAVGGEA